MALPCRHRWQRGWPQFTRCCIRTGGTAVVADAAHCPHRHHNPSGFLLQEEQWQAGWWRGGPEPPARVGGCEEQPDHKHRLN